MISICIQCDANLEAGGWHFQGYNKLWIAWETQWMQASHVTILHNTFNVQEHTNQKKKNPCMVTFYTACVVHVCVCVCVRAHAHACELVLYPFLKSEN
jgi:hypothetical protein